MAAKTKNYFASGFINFLNRQIKTFGGVAGLIVFSFPAIAGRGRERKMTGKILLRQVFYTGNQALPLIGVVGFLLGSVTVLQLFIQLSKFGALDYVGQILNIVIVRELGPLITAFIVIARSSTAIAAEIGAMVTSNQTDALEMLGIDPMKFIVSPRIIGMVISLFFLTVYFDAIGILGGFFIGYLGAGITFDMFMTYVMNSISLLDIFTAIMKSLAFGFFISAIPVYYGFQASSTVEIPRVTTKSVMACIGTAFFLDLVITVIFYM